MKFAVFNPDNQIVNEDVEKTGTQNWGTPDYKIRKTLHILLIFIFYFPVFK